MIYIYIYTVYDIIYICCLGVVYHQRWDHKQCILYLRYGDHPPPKDEHSTNDFHDNHLKFTC